jgi:hypothetical protein
MNNNNSIKSTKSVEQFIFEKNGTKQSSNSSISDLEIPVNQVPLPHDDNYLKDPLFSDVVYFANKQDGTLGIQQCYERAKPGDILLEYGMTGNCYLWPARKQ